MIVAIDQSLSRTGVALYLGDVAFDQSISRNNVVLCHKYEISFFSIPTTKKGFRRNMDRIEYITYKLIEKLTDLNVLYCTKDIVFESYLYNSGFRTYQNFDVIELVGAIKIIFLQKLDYRGAEFCDVNCSTWKKHVTGNGKSNKKEYTQKIKELGYNVGNEDEAAAVGILLTYLEKGKK